MEYRRMPGTGLEVSVLSLGTMQFGAQTNEADSLAIMDFAFDAGINVIDTANSYNSGESEKVVGKWLAKKRDSVILATKAGNPVGKGPNASGLGRRHLITALEDSLRRLGTDYIDIYYMHKPDYFTPFEETLETMNSFVRAGKVRYIGVSNYAAWQMADILAVSERRGYIPPVVTQNVYNLITRGVETELVPFLSAHNMGMFVYNPIAAGLLSGKHSPGTPAPDTRFAQAHNQSALYYGRYWTAGNFAAVEKLKKAARDHGFGLLELAMKWCARQKTVASIITGVSRLSQLEENVGLLEGKVPDSEILAECDEVWASLSGNRFAYNR